MEVGGSGARQSGPPLTTSSSSSRLDQHPQHTQPIPSMATAALISPSPMGPYHSHTPSYSPSYPNPSTTPNIASMISPIESRRTSDDSTNMSHPPPPQRQSLPSLSDVLSIAKPPTFAPPQPQPPQSQMSVAGTAPLPPPFSAAAPPPRPPFPDRAPSSEQDSPVAVHRQPASHFPPRSTLPLHNGFAVPRQHSPSGPRPNREQQQDGRPETSHITSNAYPGHPPAPQPMLYPPAPGVLPPGQLPLTPQYPISPRTSGIPPHPYDNRGPPPPHSHHRDEFGRSAYYSGVSRGHDFVHLFDYLVRIKASSRTIQSFASHWSPIIEEHHGNQAIPSRLPRMQEINDMINNAEHVTNSLEQMREIMQQNLAETERRGLETAAGSLSTKGKGPEEGSSDTVNKPPYPSYGAQQTDSAVKKRPGRAAPPGRCHSCNRSDTPEWRRGPDGARTLCNACGLHFAKLNKKLKADGRTVRTKTDMD